VFEFSVVRFFEGGRTRLRAVDFTFMYSDVGEIYLSDGGGGGDGIWGHLFLINTCNLCAAIVPVLH
jgi:hypothetical protein